MSARRAGTPYLVLLELRTDSGAGHPRLDRVCLHQGPGAVAGHRRHAARRALERVDALLHLAATGLAAGQYGDLPDLVRTWRAHLELQEDRTRTLSRGHLAVYRCQRRQRDVHQRTTHPAAPTVPYRTDTVSRRGARACTADQADPYLHIVNNMQNDIKTRNVSI